MATLSLTDHQQHDQEEQALIAGKRRRRFQEAMIGYMFVLPATIATFLFGLWPVISGFYESIKSGSPLTNKYVGLDNYLKSLGSLTYIVLFLLSLIFLYMGYRSWRSAFMAARSNEDNLWLYLVPGFLIGAGVIILAFNFVTGAEAVSWLPLTLILVALAGYYTADQLQGAQDGDRARDLLITWIAFLALAGVWIALGEIESGATSKFVSWTVLLAIPAWLLYVILPRLQDSWQGLRRSRRDLAHEAQALSPTELSAIRSKAAHQRRREAFGLLGALPGELAEEVASAIDAARKDPRNMVRSLLSVGLIILGVVLAAWVLNQVLLWPFEVALVLTLLVGLLIAAALAMRTRLYILAARDAQDTYGRLYRLRSESMSHTAATIGLAIAGLITLMIMGVLLFGVIGARNALLYVALIVLGLIALPRLARLRRFEYVGATIMVGLLMLLAVLLSVYTVKQMNDDVAEAQRISRAIFDADLVSAKVDATDAELGQETRITNLDIVGDGVVEVEVDGEVIQAPLAPEMYVELPASKIQQFEAGFGFKEKVMVVLPDGSVVEGSLTDQAGVTFSAQDPELVRQIPLYSALEVGEGAIQSQGHTEPLLNQVYATLGVFISIALIALMTSVRRRVDEDYEPDTIRELFGIGAAWLTAALPVLGLAGVGYALDGALDLSPLFTLALAAAGLGIIGGVVVWGRQDDSGRATALAQQFGPLYRALQIVYLVALVVGIALVIGAMFDNALGTEPVFTLILGGAAALSLVRSGRWLLNRHPSVRSWMYWGRVLMAIVVLVLFFYLIGSVQLSQQAASGMASLTEDQFKRSYKFAFGENPHPSVRAAVLTAQLEYWPQVFLIGTGAFLIGMAYIVWQSAQQRESKRGFAFTIMLAIMMMVGGWMTISELPRTMSLTGRSAEDTLDALNRTAMYSIGTVPIQLGLGLFLAYLLFSEISWGKSLYRVVYFMPYIAPSVATSTVFLVIFSPKPKSLANQVLDWVGLDQQIWLKEPAGIVRIFYEHILGGNPANIPEMLQGPSLALFTVILYNIWVFAGYNAVVFLAGLGAIPGELYEAAEVDGAGRWSRFRSITLPLLSPTTFFLSMLSIIGTFKAFSHIYVLREQSTKPEIDTMSVHIFKTLYTDNDPGYAAALAFTLFGVILILTLVQNRLAREQVFYG